MKSMIRTFITVMIVFVLTEILNRGNSFLPTLATLALYEAYVAQNQKIKKGKNDKEKSK